MQSPSNTHKRKKIFQSCTPHTATTKGATRCRLSRYIVSSRHVITNEPRKRNYYYYHYVFPRLFPIFFDELAGFFPIVDSHSKGHPSRLPQRSNLFPQSFLFPWQFAGQIFFTCVFLVFRVVLFFSVSRDVGRVVTAISRMMKFKSKNYWTLGARPEVDERFTVLLWSQRNLLLALRHLVSNALRKLSRASRDLSCFILKDLMHQEVAVAPPHCYC